MRRTAKTMKRGVWLLVLVLAMFLFVGAKSRGIKVTSGTAEGAQIPLYRDFYTFVVGKGLSPGNDKVKVGKEGYEPYEEGGLHSRGESLTVKAILGPLMTRSIPLRAGGREQLAADSLREDKKSFTNSLGMNFRLIPAGSFMMGSGISTSEVASQYGGKEKWYKREHPQHRVTISKPFYIQTEEVTVGQWRSFIQDTGYKSEAETGGGVRIWIGSRWEKKDERHWDNPGFEQSDKDPVTSVSWNDVQAFVKWLNRKEGKPYRLPTEAEWEYAARAGSTTRFCFGNDKERLGEYAWYRDNSGGRTHPVAQKKPNIWGLNDMHGNVWEWCQDWYGDYPPGSVTDPTGPSSGSRRVLRGGSWSLNARHSRSANRRRYEPADWYYGLGFRLAATP